MRRVIEAAAIVAGVMALSAPAAVAQPHAAYPPFINICGREIALSNQPLLNRTVEACFRGRVRVSARSTSVTISFDPAIMPLIGVGPGRPPRPGLVMPPR